MPNFKESQRGTASLLPASVGDCLSENHLACYVVGIVDGLDLTALAPGFFGWGKAAYHPSVMVAPLFQSCASGVYSSRKIEGACFPYASPPATWFRTATPSPASAGASARRVPRR